MTLLAFIESYYLFVAVTPRNGLDFLFVIPLFFAFCVLTFGRVILPYQEKGIGLKIYYGIVLVRYLLQPFLIVLSDGKLNVRMPEAKADSYPIAIFIYCIELFIACLVIKKWFPFYIKKYAKTIKSKSQIPLNTYGKNVLIVFLLFLLLRFNSWIPGLKILGLKESYSSVAVVFDATIFNCLKGYLFIVLLVEAKRHSYYKSQFKFYFSLAFLAAIFNFISYFGSNRSFIYETAIATLVILIYSYPQFKKKILAIILPLALSMMFFSYVNKQFATDNAITFRTQNTFTLISTIVEEYSNGLWTVARSYQASAGLSSKASFEAFIKDLSDGFSGLSDLPFIKTLNSSLSGLRSSSTIFKDSLKQRDDRGQMLSLSGGFLIIGGNLLGWPFLVIGNYLMIRLLVKMEVASKIVKDLYYKYMYIWMSILMGLVHCYCLQTIVFCWSKFILFYWLVLFINELGCSKRVTYGRHQLTSVAINSEVNNELSSKIKL
ncbi:hypothetical protein [Flavobacterium aquiphilum]|uniref:hypothetical protein n=1 Tax=Flavobacterium aquiphilum TaxID=3003261 RepID=UPI0024805F1D|nr:hypothetical protein [Flavobacterium aquiphilum]